MIQRKPFQVAGIVALVAIVTACGANDDKGRALQLAAKVNKGAVSVDQISDVKARAGNLNAEQSQQVGKQVLERLIDQELLVQQAMDKKLDADPKVVQAIESARREILARSYVDQVAGAALKPTAAEVSEFFAKHPELFAERRLYRVNELRLPANAQVAQELRAFLNQPKSMNDVAGWLREKNIRFAAGSDTRAAEQVPLGLLPQLHKLKDGDMTVMESQNAVLVVQVVASQTQPIDEKAATPFIERHLTNLKRNDLGEAELKRLRQTAKIEYLGEYAAGAAAPAVSSKPAEGQPFGATEPVSPASPVVPAPAAK